jgi:hypothetical protein
MGEGQDVRDQLAAANESYQGIGDGPDAPPPGLYKFQLAGAEFRNKKDGGELLIMWTHLVLEGEHQGEQMNDFSKPTSKQRYPIQLMRQRINRLGWTAPDDLRELEEIIPQMDKAGPIYTGLVTHSAGKQGGVFANVEVKDLIEQYGATSGQRAATAGQQQAPDAGVSVGDEVSFDDDGETFTGTVGKVVGDEAEIDVPGEKDKFMVPVDLLRPAAPPPSAEEPVADEGTEPEPTAEASKLDELIAFAIGQGYDVPEGITEESLAKTLSEDPDGWKADKLLPEEVALLEGFSIPVEAAEPPKAARKAVKKTAKKAAKKTAKKAARKKAARRASRK